ncbi:hypothetical protein V865_005685 [Kwoniella europaea PYCC6329]|uniref:Uncharacterized protein n=1 Tax=Kwoniella europaea PYCC6329 TaxID=1423913 RepID=A0AAX4KNP1_9TREE
MSSFLGQRTSETGTTSNENENSIDSARKSRTLAVLSEIDALLNKSQSSRHNPKSHSPYHRRNDSGFFDSAYGSDESASNQYQTSSKSANYDESDASSLSSGSLEHSSDDLDDTLPYGLSQRLRRHKVGLSGERSISAGEQNGFETFTQSPSDVVHHPAHHPNGSVTSESVPGRPNEISTGPQLSSGVEFAEHSPQDPVIADNGQSISSDSSRSFDRTRLKDIEESDEEVDHHQPSGPFLNRGPDYTQTSLKSSQANSLQRTASIHGRPRRRPSSVRSGLSETSNLSSASRPIHEPRIDPDDMQTARDQYYEDPYTDTSKTDLEIYEEYSRTGSPRSSTFGIISPITPQVHTGESTGFQSWTNDRHSSVSSRSNARSYLPSFLQNRRRPSISSQGSSHTGKSRLSSISYVSRQMGRWKNHFSSMLSRDDENSTPRRKASDVEAELYGNISQAEATRRTQTRDQSLRVEGTRYEVPPQMQEWINQLPMGSEMEPENETSSSPSISLTSVNDEVDDWFRNPSFDLPTSGSSRTGVSLEDALSRLMEERRIKDQQLVEHQSQNNVYARYWGSHTEEGKYDATEDEQEISILRSQISTLQDRLGELESRLYQF